jgi:hypothetical protein
MQPQRRLHHGALRDVAKLRGQTVQIADIPYHHGAAALEVGEIDPRPALGLAVDQHARMPGRVMGDIAAGEHARDHIVDRVSGSGAIALR